MTEAEFQRRLEIALNKAGGDTRVWRQNAGRFAVVNKPVVKRLVPALRRARSLTFKTIWDLICKLAHWVQGAPKGAADLTGIVRPEGWRLEVECKGADTRIETHQAKWAAAMQRMGAISVLCRVDPSLTDDDNVTQAIELVNEAIAARRSA